MTKELKALERLYCAGRLDLDYVLNGDQSRDYKLIEESLKALEIIKEKQVDVNYEIFCSKDYNHYKTKAEKGKFTNVLTQNEYDLLKEELL